MPRPGQPQGCWRRRAKPLARTAFSNSALASLRHVPRLDGDAQEDSGVASGYAETGLLSVASTEDAFCRLKRGRRGSMPQVWPRKS